MKVKELLEYLGMFEGNEDVGVIVVDTEKRLHHICNGYDLLKEHPCILLDTNKSECLDDIIEAAKEAQETIENGG